MSEILERIKALAASGEIRISSHGYDELNEDHITTRDVVSGVASATAIEDYPDFPKGECVLALQRDRNEAPIHVVWGIPKGYDRPAVLITAYRPDSSRWSEDFLRRR